MARKNSFWSNLFQYSQDYKCPVCEKPIEVNATSCLNCSVIFRYYTTKEKSIHKSTESVWPSDYPEPRFFCPLGYHELERNAPSCPECHFEFILDKSGVWPVVKAKPDLKPQFCPHCSNELEPNTEMCDVCGVYFKWKRPFSHYGNVWPFGKPEILEALKDTKEKSIKPIDDALSEWNLSKERSLELFESWEHGSIHPAAFLRFVLEEYSKPGVKNELFQAMTLEEYISYLISILPKNPSSWDEVQKASSLDGHYDKHWLDYCLGGGWVPLCDDYTLPAPCRWLSPHVLYYSQDYDTDFVYALVYDRLMYQWQKHQALIQEKDSEGLCCFRLALSDKDDITPNQMERFWTSLQSIGEPVIFEIVGSGAAHTISFQFLCHPQDKAHVVHQLVSLFPNSLVNVQGNDDDFLIGQVGSDYSERFAQDFHSCGVSFGLARHYSWELRTLSTFDKTDPLGSLIASLAELDKDEGGVIQALVFPLKDWEKNFESVEKFTEAQKEKVKSNRRVGRGNTDFKDYPIAKKRQFPPFGVNFRAMTFGRKEKTSGEKLQSQLEGIDLERVALPESNRLCLEPKESYGAIDTDGSNHSRIFPEIFKEVSSRLEERELLSVLERKTYRHGFILNSQELATLCHFPPKALQHPKLLRQDAMLAKAPEEVTEGNGLLIGINEFFGQSQEVYVPEDFRFRHMYTVGKTGTGKSTFLFNLLRADIEAGKGVGLIDPHGDLVEQILRVIPEERIDDVILFDPSDYEHPIGFNMMEVKSSQERRQMRNDILVAIRRLFDDASWGDNIDQLFRSSIATLLADYRHSHTLLDIRRLISDDVFRSQVLRRIDDDFLTEFWTEDFPHFTRMTVSAVRRRLGSVLSEPEVRNILAQQQTSFNFKEMMDTRKIFLVKLSRGTLGEDISHLFGGLLVSKIQLTAMARESQPESERVPFYLYVDEFQNFVNEGFEIILSEARKYKLCLTMAHQFTAQLPRGLHNAVFGNVGTLIVFQTGVDDAMALEKQLGKFSKDDILNLERFHTITRIGKAKEAFSMKTLPPPETVVDTSERVKAASREKYCRLVDEDAGGADPVHHPQEEVEERPDALEAPVQEDEAQPHEETVRPTEQDTEVEKKDKEDELDFFE